MTSDFYTASILPHAGILIKMCRAYTDTQEDFEDAYQEVCLQIWKSRERFRGDAEWTTWIYRISLNVCLTLLKQRKSDDERRDPSAAAADVAVQPAPFADEPVQRLYAAIRQLSEVDRGVILLHLEEKSHQQIAEITGTNANNVGVRIHRIKERLRRLI